MDMHTILLISKDTDLSDIYADYLDDVEDRSFILINATTLEEAIKSLNDFYCQCILFDLDTTDITPRHLKQSANSTVPPKELLTIALSDQNKPEKITEYMKAGFSDFLYKANITKDLLVKTIVFAIEKNDLYNTIKRQQRFTTALTDTIPNPIFYKDIYGKYTRCNASFSQLISIPQNDISGKTDTELFDNETAQLFTLHDKELLENENTITYEGKYIRDDKTINLLLNKASIKNEENAIIGIIGIATNITTQKETEHQLRLFSQIVKNSAASIVITDPEGTITYVNPKFTEVTGYSSDEVIGQNPRILKSETQDRTFYERLWNTIKQGKVWKGEFHNIKKDGESFWEIASIAPIIDDDNNITHFISVKEDITYLKIIEVVLKESEEKLKILFESIGEGIAVTDLNGMIYQVNKSFLLLHSITDKKDILGREIFDFIWEEDKELIVQKFDETLNNKYATNIEYKILTRDNTKKDGEINIGLLTDNQNKPSGFVVLTKDITERKESERALRLSEERNREILESIPDLMFNINRKGEYLDVSLHSKVLKVFPQKIIEQSMPFIEMAFNSNKIQIFEYPVYFDGELNYYEARYIISGPDELLVILRNISQRIEVQEELKKARDDAEAANIAKSYFLANMSHEIRTPLNGLLGFIELLNRTDLTATQQEYFNIVSESAQSLLGIINDILDFSKIESGKLDIDTIEFNPHHEFESSIDLFTVRALEKNITLLSFIDPALPNKIMGDPLRIKQVFTNLLSNAIKFTQEGGTITLTVKILTCSEHHCTVFFSVADNGIGIEPAKQQKIFEAFSQADPSVTRNYGGTGLGLSISSNLINLMGGSLQLQSEMGKGSNFHFTLNFACTDHKNTLQSLITFTGRHVTVGIISPDKNLSEITDILLEYFDSFDCNTIIKKNLHNTADLKNIDLLLITPHTGNNLLNEVKTQYKIPIIYVARNLENPDSRYSDAIDKVIKLPINATKILHTLSELLPDKVSIKMQYVTKKNQEEQLPVFNASVLVAEDNVINQKLIKLMLKDFNLNVVIAPNGIDVIDKSKKQNFDLIFMDINMPIYDGVEATKIIREELPDIPIVALTAKTVLNDKQKYFEAGMNDYLLKPVGLQDLKHILIKYLSHKIISTTPYKQTAVPDSALQLQPEKQASTEILYDLEETAKILGIKPESLVSILQDFFKTTKPQLNELGIFIQNENYDKINEISHKLKGSALNLHIHRPAEILQEIEDKAENREGYNYQKKFEECKLLFSSYEKHILHQ